MHAIVTIGSASCLKVAAYVPAKRRGLIRNRIAAAIAARKQAVPEALSQFNSNTAA